MSKKHDASRALETGQAGTGEYYIVNRNGKRVMMNGPYYVNCAKADELAYILVYRKNVFRKGGPLNYFVHLNGVKVEQPLSNNSNLLIAVRAGTKYDVAFHMPHSGLVNMDATTVTSKLTPGDLYYIEMGIVGKILPSTKIYNLGKVYNPLPPPPVQKQDDATTTVTTTVTNMVDNPVVTTTVTPLSTNTTMLPPATNIPTMPYTTAPAGYPYGMPYMPYPYYSGGFMTPPPTMMYGGYGTVPTQPATSSIPYLPDPATILASTQPPTSQSPTTLYSQTTIQTTTSPYPTSAPPGYTYTS